MRVLSLFTVVFALAFASCNQGSETAKLNNEIDSMSYAYGVYMASNVENPDFKEVEKDVLLQGMKAALLDSNTALFNKEEAYKILDVYFKKKQEAKSKELSEEGIKWLQENGKKEGVTTTASGLEYEVLLEGTGAKPTAADRVRVHYTGTLLDGKVFDSSVQRGEPIVFPLSGVIKGWTEGIQLMSVGSKYKFYIPYNLAYGERGEPRAGIKPYATLIFEVELLEINPEETKAMPK